MILIVMNTSLLMAVASILDFSRKSYLSFSFGVLSVVFLNFSSANLRRKYRLAYLCSEIPPQECMSKHSLEDFPPRRASLVNKEEKE